MVIVCNNVYPREKEEIYQEHFEKYSFPLSPFQKYAIEAIVTSNHILVTAHTGSGKTLPAEFAIEYFVKSKGKKVIYTSPIKALSNQKFWEFTQKFPTISFGILTGDIKINPQADVLIMTTEILQNKLFHRKEDGFGIFDMDLDNDLACVIFDEVHYINDADRGRVWEETIMMLPNHVQMVMLSATLDKPERFAQWCEDRDGCVKTSKEEDLGDLPRVYLTTTYERVVPLTHYSFITVTQGLFKAIKDKDLEKTIREQTGKPFVIQTARGEFKEEQYHKTQSVLELLEKKRVFVKRSHVLNQVTKYMVDNEMLPAICFILSRKQLEIAAKEVTTILLEDDSKVPYIVRRECEQIVRKLPNFREYLELPEYNEMVALLEKGIAVHHAGIMPVLREMVELLFAKGFIKLLFATETFAVGINMPTKTVVFTDINKFDGSGSRLLYSHEFTQMAGRAGRRGIDTVGNVIHLHNLFKNVSLTEYRLMMRGTPQTLTSKFRVSYSLLLNLMEQSVSSMIPFVEQSMCQKEIDIGLQSMGNELREKEKEIKRMETSFCSIPFPLSLLQEYLSLLKERKTAINKRKKEVERDIEKIKDEYKNIDFFTDSVEKYNKLCQEVEKEKLVYEKTRTSFYDEIQLLSDFLQEQGFVSEELKKTVKGHIATHLREVPCLAFAELIFNNDLDALSVEELVGLFSCFTNVTVADELRTLYKGSSGLETVLGKVAGLFDRYEQWETSKQLCTGTDYSMHYDLVDATIKWTQAGCVEECKWVLQRLEETKGIFLGEFVKAVMKINNIAAELERIAEDIGNISLLSRLKEIPVLTQKYVATNQSLYV